MIHVIVMAGLVPAIHVFASHRSVRPGCVDARIKSGHDELVGIMHHLKESEHQIALAPLELEPDTTGPDILRLQRAFLISGVPCCTDRAGERIFLHFEKRRVHPPTLSGRNSTTRSFCPIA
jgi:hypothetical protein